LEEIEDLYITEKFTQLEDLAKVLDCEVGRNWYPAYNKEKKIAIVPLKGHLFELLTFPHDYDPAFKQWEEKTILCFPKEFRKKPKSNTNIIEQLNRTVDHIKRAKNIYIASDFDNEGANLAYTVIKYAGGEAKVKRMLEMGSTTEEALKRTLENPIDIPYELMSDAGDARAFIDWAEGMTYSRALTVHLAKKRSTLLFGGVKSPILKFVVERDLQFEAHSSIKYYTLSGTAKAQDKEFNISIYRKIDGKQEKKFDKKEHANMVSKDILEKAKFKIVSFMGKIKKEGPKQLYDLVEISAEMSRNFGLSAEESLNVAQKLYQEYKIQSYPRTAIKYLKSEDYSVIPNYLKNVSSVMHKDIIDQILENKLLKRSTVFNSSKVTSHGGLTPTEEKNLEKVYLKMTAIEKGMFDKVSTRFIANFMPDFEYKEYKGEVHLYDDIYASFSEKEPLKAGWKYIYNNKINEEIESYQKTLPELKKDEEIEIIKIETKEGETKPKPRFTEETLQLAMGNIANIYPEDKILKEQLGDTGIGTPATIPGILKDLFSTVGKDGKEKEPWLRLEGKKVVSTPIARELVKVTPDHIISPVKRAKMFKKIKLIETGELSLEDFLAQYKEEMEENIKIIKKLGEDPENIVKPKNDNEKLGKCPLCKKGEIFETAKAFICTEAQWKKEKDKTGKEVWKNEGCSYAIFKKQMEKFGKANITKSEVKRFLSTGKMKLKLKNPNSKESYDTELVFSEKYGLGFPPKKEYNSIGSCPFCDGQILDKDKTFACSNAKWKKDGDNFKNIGCTFQVVKGKFKNQGKPIITTEEIQILLESGELEIELESKAGNKYTKTVKPDLKWGLGWAQ
jgi:DNA topoisomerase-3